MNMRDIVAALRGGMLQQDRLLKRSWIRRWGRMRWSCSGRWADRRSVRDYAFTLDVLSPDDTIELKKLIAQPVTLWIQQASGDDYWEAIGASNLAR